MKNPREDIELDTYEKHMSLDSVFQYQILNKIICLQLNDYDVNCVCILGIGGFLLALIGFGLIFSWSQLVGTIMIWIFALWALIRGVMLIIFGINNKDQQPLR